ncbi:unnamed protein product [Macrosiphum euphorbiae]|uniref:DUF4371 domain-containing protein n=1 Tax=Macrosiphum euphorbiae TaxID=13131 RepID=A0AAV0WQT8_9HEMI|nr:unnamed protein product [Macrosiphum euphorbiae]
MDKKRKGGAQKQREKKNKLLISEASKCKNLDSYFTSSKNINIISNNSLASANSHLNQNTGIISNENFKNVSSITVDQYSKDQASTSSSDTNLDTIVKPIKCNTENEVYISNNISKNIEKTYDNSSIFFCTPLPNERNQFFEYHPIQPFQDMLPFNPRLVFQRKDGSNRQWLTFSHEKKTLFCTCCLAYGDANEKNCLVTGVSEFNPKHLYSTLERHENSQQHRNNTEAYFLNFNKADIKNLIFVKQTSLKQLEVQKNREILERIIETIKTIGKRGLSFRGKRHEAAYSLTDETLDHGTFLEILILLGKFDPILKNHLDHVALKSKKAHQKKKTGRGSLVTFFSKTTINSIIQIICQIMRQNIVNEIKSAGMFSIQIDTTQDVKVEDQCSIIIRYLTDSVKERLIAVTNVKSSTGESMFQLVKETLEINGVDLKYCIGSSTDGASNMQGRYKGFSKYLSDENPSQLHVWCYAHCLNLVMIDVTEITIESVKFFSLLNECANFLRESYKRMDVWKELCGNNKRLAKAGDTRWWSKESSITTIFGHFGMPESALYVVLISVMSKIANSDKFNRETRYKAITLKDSFLKYSFVMTSQLYLRIFERISPLSKYLQTSGMDLVQAYRMVSSTITYLQEISRDFQRVKEATDSFIVWAEKELEEVDCDEILESQFPDESSVRRKIKKKMPGEVSRDQLIINPLEKFKITVHNIVLDTIINKLNERFTKHGSLYSDLSLLDPTNFKDINDTMSKKAFTRLSDLIIFFDKTATPENLRHELFDFKEKWPSIKYTVPESYDKNVDDYSDESSYESDSESIKNQLILQEVGNEEVKDKLAKSSPLMSKLLLH